MTTLVDVRTSIGRKVRARRSERRWTLDDLADRSGVSRRQILLIEQGQTNPSIAVLLRISDALGVGLPHLIAVAEPRALRVVRRGDAPTLWAGEHGGQARLIAGSGPPDVLELWDWTLHPGEAHRSEAHTRGTVEQLLVEQGDLLLVVGGEQQRLAPGDAAVFQGDRPHSYAAAPDREGPTRFILSTLQPGVGLTREAR